MRVEVYTLAWNDERMLPFFLQHYAPWADRIVVFDDGSDDGTGDLLTAHPKVEVRRLPPKGDSFVLTALQIYEHAWKESRGHADWVVVTNVDEFIHHADGMGTYLRRCTERGVTMVRPRGYEMVGPAFPPAGESLVASVRRGVPVFGLDKRQVFAPDAIAAINFLPGRHGCDPTGRVVESEPVEAQLLHYKCIDPDGYYLQRIKMLNSRLLDGDRARKFGRQYGLDREVLRQRYRWLDLHATEVVATTAVPTGAE